jgi:hypothetical protein
MGAFTSGSPANRKQGNPLGLKCPPCLHIFQAFSVYFLKAQQFYLAEMQLGAIKI